MKRPEKYFWFEHAERNAIYNATLTGTSLAGCRMYTNGMPCADCGRAIIQSGIEEIIVDYNWDKSDKGYGQNWSESCNKTHQMFKELNLKVREWKGPLLQIYKQKGGTKL